MKFNDIIRAAMQETGTLQRDLGEKLGIQQNAVSNTIIRPNITLSKFTEIMDILGYDIVIRSRSTPESKYTLTNEEE